MAALSKTIDKLFSGAADVAQQVTGPSRVRAISDAERQARIRVKQSDGDADDVSSIVDSAKTALSPGWDEGFDDADQRDHALVQHAVEHTVRHMRARPDDVPSPGPNNYPVQLKHSGNVYKPTVLERAVERMTGVR